MATSTADFFAGHLGHLTPTQEQSFFTFRDNLAKADLYVPSTGTSKPSHDDPTLLYVFLESFPRFNLNVVQKALSPCPSVQP
jgi:hypothetical protein